MLKKMLFISVWFALLLSACANTTPPAGSADVLTVSSESAQKTYTAAGLQALPATEAVFNGSTYVGVSLPALLADAGFASSDIKAVKAVAVDGYSVNYDASIFTRDDVIVAYALADGALSADDGVFRMVLPGEAGKLNVRMLVTLEIVP